MIHLTWERHGLAKKTVSCLLTVFFTLSMVSGNAWGAVDVPGISYDLAASSREGFSPIDPETFNLPHDMGLVRHSFKGDPNKLLIHIQDAHCNYDAQKQISNIIQHLNKEYGVSMINLEGGVGSYDLSPFTEIENKTLRDKVGDFFVGQGLVNAAEYFALNNSDDVSLWGVENEKLYLDNLKIYRESLTYKEKVDKYLNELTHIINNLKRRIFSDELRDIDEVYTQYKAERIEFKDYLTYMISKAKEKAIDVKSYTNIYLLKQSLEEETKINFKKANIERDELVDLLKNKLSQRELKDLVAKTLEFEAKMIPQREYYEELVKKAKIVNISLEDYPELRKYIIYVSLYGAVDKTKVISELDALEADIKEIIFQNEKQKELDRLSKDLVITKNIFNLKLSKDDYIYYQKNRSDFDVSNFTSFIEKEAPYHKITARPDRNIRELDYYRGRIEKFFDYSFKRDDVFLDNIRFASVGAKEPRGGMQIAILITGGFHTENICELLEKKGISHISILPTFRSEEGYESPYFKILAGERSGLGTLLTEAVSRSTMQVASMWNRLGLAADGEAAVNEAEIMVEIAKKLVEGEDAFVTLEGSTTGIKFSMEDGTVTYSLERGVSDALADVKITSTDNFTYEDHEAIIDTQLATAVRTLLAFNAESDIVKFFRAMGYEGIADAIVSGEINIFSAEGIVGFRGHASHRGVHVSADLSLQEQVKVIVHEIGAYYGLSDELNQRMENLFERFNRSGEVALEAVDLAQFDKLGERKALEAEQAEERDWTARRLERRMDRLLSYRIFDKLISPEKQLQNRQWKRFFPDSNVEFDYSNKQLEGNIDGRIPLTAPSEITVAGKRYEIKEFINSGGMGAIFKAVEAEGENVGREVVVKILNPELNASEQIRFFQEYLMMRKMDGDPAVVNAFNAGTYQEGEKTFHFMVQEFMDGGTLQDLIYRQRAGLTFDQLMDLERQILNIVVTLHENGIIHADLKPDNIFVKRDPVTGQITLKVSDFGISLYAPEGRVYMDVEGGIAGTVAHMPLETMRTKQYDFRTDLYAAGTIMYELFYGRLPYMKTPKSRELPRWFQERAKLIDELLKSNNGFDILIAGLLLNENGNGFGTAEEVLRRMGLMSYRDLDIVQAKFSRMKQILTQKPVFTLRDEESPFANIEADVEPGEPIAFMTEEESPFVSLEWDEPQSVPTPGQIQDVLDYLLVEDLVPSADVVKVLDELLPEEAEDEAAIPRGADVGKALDDLFPGEAEGPTDIGGTIAKGVEFVDARGELHPEVKDRIEENSEGAWEDSKNKNQTDAVKERRKRLLDEKISVLEELLRGHGYDASEVEEIVGIVEDALNDPEGSFILFEAEVLARESYLLGYESGLALNIIEYLSEEGEAGFTEEEARLYAELSAKKELLLKIEKKRLDALEDKKNILLDEYILHEALERAKLSHYEIIGITTEVFGRGDFFDIDTFDGQPRKTPLGKALGRFLDARAPPGELSAEEMIALSNDAISNLSVEEARAIVNGIEATDRFASKISVERGDIGDEKHIRGPDDRKEKVPVPDIIEKPGEGLRYYIAPKTSGVKGAKWAADGGLIDAGGFGFILMADEAVIPETEGELVVTRPVVMKVLSPSKGAASIVDWNNPEEVARYEAKEKARFIHEYLISEKAQNIDGVAKIRTAGFYEVDGKTYYYMVMDRYEEGDLLEEIERRTDRALEEKNRLGLEETIEYGDVFSEKEVIKFADFLINTTKELHNGRLIHRDLKPANILLTRDADGEQGGVVADFGLSEYVPEGEKLEVRGVLSGTPLYLPLEAIAQSPSIFSSKTDLFAIGAILYEMLYGDLPANWMNQRIERINEIFQNPESTPLEIFIASLLDEEDAAIKDASLASELMQEAANNPESFKLRMETVRAAKDFNTRLKDDLFELQRKGIDIGSAADFELPAVSDTRMNAEEESRIFRRNSRIRRERVDRIAEYNENIVDLVGRKYLRGSVARYLMLQLNNDIREMSAEEFANFIKEKQTNVSRAVLEEETAQRDRAVARERKARNNALQTISLNDSVWTGFIDISKMGQRNIIGDTAEDPKARKEAERERDAFVARVVETIRGELALFSGSAVSPDERGETIGPVFRTSGEEAGDEIVCVLPGYLTESDIKAIFIRTQDKLLRSGIDAFIPGAFVKRGNTGEDPFEILKSGINDAESLQEQFSKVRMEGGERKGQLITVSEKFESTGKEERTILSGPNSRVNEWIKLQRDKAVKQAEALGLDIERAMDGPYYPVLKEGMLLEVVEKALLSEEPSINFIRGPPDTLYVVIGTGRDEYGRSRVQIHEKRREYTARSDQTEEYFEIARARSGRGVRKEEVEVLGEARYGFKDVQDGFALLTSDENEGYAKRGGRGSLGHGFGDEVIALELASDVNSYMNIFRSGSIFTRNGTMDVSMESDKEFNRYAMQMGFQGYSVVSEISATADKGTDVRSLAESLIRNVKELGSGRGIRVGGKVKEEFSEELVRNEVPKALDDASRNNLVDAVNPMASRGYVGDEMITIFLEPRVRFTTNNIANMPTVIKDNYRFRVRRAEGVRPAFEESQKLNREVFEEVQKEFVFSDDPADVKSRLMLLVPDLLRTIGLDSEAIRGFMSGLAERTLTKDEMNDVLRKIQEVVSEVRAEGTLENPLLDLVYAFQDQERDMFHIGLALADIAISEDIWRVDLAMRDRIAETAARKEWDNARKEMNTQSRLAAGKFSEDEIVLTNAMILAMKGDIEGAENVLKGEIKDITITPRIAMEYLEGQTQYDIEGFKRFINERLGEEARRWINTLDRVSGEESRTQRNLLQVARPVIVDHNVRQLMSPNFQAEVEKARVLEGRAPAEFIMDQFGRIVTFEPGAELSEAQIRGAMFVKVNDALPGKRYERMDSPEISVETTPHVFDVLELTEEGMNILHPLGEFPSAGTAAMIAEGGLKDKMETIETEGELEELVGPKLKMTRAIEKKIDEALMFLIGRARRGDLDENIKDMIRKIIGKEDDMADRRRAREDFLKSVYLFNAAVEGGENYILGFNSMGNIGLSVELINRLTAKDLAEYMFHEVNEIGIGHRELYGKGEARGTSIQGRIFGRANTLGRHLRNLIDQQAREVEAPAVEIELEEAAPEVERARPAYEAAAKIAPEIVEVIMKESPTFDMAPVSFKGVSRNANFRKRLSKIAENIQADNYIFDQMRLEDGEWFNELISEGGKLDKMARNFIDSFLKDRTSRMMVRLIKIGEVSRRQELIDFIKGIVASDERVADVDEVMARVFVIDENIGVNEHLNTVIDLLTDIAIMENDRYEKEDYGEGEEAPVDLKQNLADLLMRSATLRISDTNEALEALTIRNLDEILQKLFTGEITLEVKGIDWETIREWADAQNEVLISL